MNGNGKQPPVSIRIADPPPDKMKELTLPWGFDTGEGWQDGKVYEMRELDRGPEGQQRFSLTEVTKPSRARSLPDPSRTSTAEH